MRAVLVLIDGARVDVLRELLARGELPNLARWVIEPGGLTAGTTVFPSTTGVAYIPFLFGRYPGSVNIPGIRWLDRGEAAGDWRAQWRAARSYCGAQGGWINQDIAPAPSLFDLVPESIAICNPLTRGLGPGANRLAGTRMALGAAAHYFGTYPGLDRAIARAWLTAADESWRFLFVVFPGIDGIAHLKEPWHPAVLESYRLVDRALGEFMKRVARRGELPALFVVSDHGMTVMREHHDVATLLEQEGWRTLRHPVHVWRRKARVAAMVSGNASIQLYVEPRSGRERPLTESEIPADLLECLLQLSAVRIAACRSDDGGVTVRTREARARLTDEGGGGLIRYTPEDGDPLGLNGYLALDDREMLTRSRETALPDAPRQLLQLFQAARAGDIVLAAQPGTDFRGPWEIPAHQSGHGSLIAEHMEVPIASSVALPEVPIRTVDLMPTVLERLGVTVPSGVAFDGVPFSRLAATTETLIR